MKRRTKRNLHVVAHTPAPKVPGFNPQAQTALMAEVRGFLDASVAFAASGNSVAADLTRSNLAGVRQALLAMVERVDGIDRILAAGGVIASTSQLQRFVAAINQAASPPDAAA